jgi:hypothetical protein
MHPPGTEGQRVDASAGEQARQAHGDYTDDAHLKQLPRFVSGHTLRFIVVVPPFILVSGHYAETCLGQNTFIPLSPERSAFVTRSRIRPRPNLYGCREQEPASRDDELGHSMNEGRLLFWLQEKY